MRSKTLYNVARLCCGSWAAVFLLGCASTNHEGGATAAAALDAQAGSLSADGLTVTRPDGWQFAAPDSSLAKDTVISMTGPLGEHVLAPAIEVGRRPLSVSDRRLQPSHILLPLTLEIVQFFESFDMVGSPEDIQVAGLPAALVRVNFTEMTADGQEVSRSARIYGIVNDDQVWVIRCMGPADGSSDQTFDAVINTLAIES